MNTFFRINTHLKEKLLLEVTLNGFYYCINIGSTYECSGSI